MTPTEGCEAWHSLVACSRFDSGQSAMVCAARVPSTMAMSEEELALGDLPPDLPRIDCVGDVVPGLAIEVAAMAVHGLNAGVHGDPDIEVVGPAHHLQVQMPRMVNVQNVLSQRPLGIIHEFALAVVLQSQRAARVLIGEGCQNLLAIARDLPIVHRPHRKHVPLHERATQGHLVCRGGVVREGRVEVPDLDADLGALHQPELTLFVEVRERVILSKSEVVNLDPRPVDGGCNFTNCVVVAGPVATSTTARMASTPMVPMPMKIGTRIGTVMAGLGLQCHRGACCPTSLGPLGARSPILSRMS
mmetsp:Transcript_43374/g.139402  ORF Transcript_43374/g.139402 Transcript_43374/m.139402 type:complete len:303 (+) Transcript_43374:272-1180(+)